MLDPTQVVLPWQENTKAMVIGWRRNPQPLCDTTFGRSDKAPGTFLFELSARRLRLAGHLAIAGKDVSRAAPLTIGHFPARSTPGKGRV